MPNIKAPLTPELIKAAKFIEEAKVICAQVAFSTVETSCEIIFDRKPLTADDISFLDKTNLSNIEFAEPNNSDTVIQHPKGTTLSSPKGTTPLALNGTT